MNLHLGLGRNVAIAVLMRGKCEAGCLAREGALVREGVVQPLREESPMEGHLTSMCCRDLLELGGECTLDLRWVVVFDSGLRRHVADERQDRVGRSQRLADRLLNLAHHALALVDTADLVVVGRNNAVVHALDVVWDNDLLAPPARGLVESAQVAQVRLGLTEAPLGLKGLNVELGERHTARVQRVHLHQGGLHVGALGLPEGSKGLRDAAHHPVSVLEGILLREGIVARP
mmetsp:Transcript_51178/g.115036  ORF Transcript_51178/g.115036 Transcript_51178/m.115036 type:complete len:231 (+) Transcript_51178:325-1017(+)